MSNEAHQRGKMKTKAHDGEEKRVRAGGNLGHPLRTRPNDSRLRAPPKPRFSVRSEMIRDPQGAFQAHQAGLGQGLQRCTSQIPGARLHLGTPQDGGAARVMELRESCSAPLQIILSLHYSSSQNPIPCQRYSELMHRRAFLRTINHECR